MRILLNLMWLKQQLSLKKEVRNLLFNVYYKNQLPSENELIWSRNRLISKQLIADGTHKSYVGLLKKISENDKFEFDIAYNLKKKLEGLGEGITKIIPSIESSVLAQKYLNIENSKNFSFNQKIGELVNNGQKLNRSMFANLIMDVYDQEDFEILLIKLKICRFIDPKSDFAVTVYAGKPNS